MFGGSRRGIVRGCPASPRQTTKVPPWYFALASGTVILAQYVCISIYIYIYIQLSRKCRSIHITSQVNYVLCLYIYIYICADTRTYIYIYIYYMYYACFVSQSPTSRCRLEALKGEVQQFSFARRSCFYL